jgi:malate dehydrogenase (oxaloacetate-decarboxylating)(NADP+)
MEGKAVLFKRFADVNSIDIELDTEDVDEFVNAVRLMGPSFGGINLEDIKAPECFMIEQRLKEIMDIPVFHDDQHGTAVICAAGLINALHLSGKKIEDCRIVLNGAGAAGIACIELLKAMGARHENCIVCDTKGVIWQGRTEGMNQWKSAHAVKTELRTLEEAMVGRGRLPRRQRQGRGDPGHGEIDGRQPGDLRHGEPRPGDHARRGARGAR